MTSAQDRASREKWVIVARLGYPKVHIARGLLESAGIPAFVIDEHS